ncbi:pilus assembly protein CpaF [Caldicellulosiruptor bescii]|uniref:Type II secretion system protein E n=2 Tax=Caldicellulosiruptor bescii TaxID=31899 RepID=B9MNJ0_CALBD|nr:ATPase, T2SS/T4P/T4SS family [Caldicellulosiruptor bescii]ACM61521.1 type II secretion system protein E [Caldicellulosiruptor bescii DSM 6725]PBC88667.1 pilus assembly protein CpaF [Caldicellulosiruptor bescii]PBC91852.1 pilus assembly protein CpaF [Caldicellulosiruptor bescii]PBD02737.1 pilus assembly protein CpaF [Caldicellulosiruptor bescii]PBD07646.1 pilus assembly protein CpaF [Caldicellulosiruptor bescii]
MGLLERIKSHSSEEFSTYDELLTYVRNKVLSSSLDVAGNLDLLKELTKQYVDKYYAENYLGLAQQHIYDYVYNMLFGLGPIEKLLKSPDVTEIYVMGTKIYYIENGLRKELEEKYPNEAETQRVIEKIAATARQTINIQNPDIDCELYDGSRALLVIPPESVQPYITIRKHTSKLKTLEELRSGYINFEDWMIDYFKNAVRSRKNIVAVGQTNAGKTTFLNALTYYIQTNHVVAVLEDTHEVELPLRYVYYFKTREGNEELRPITWSDIILNCLRANPDRIFITEIRTPEAAYGFLDALNSGHRGSLTTIHAGSTYLALQKLEMKLKEFNPNLDVRNMRILISSTIDVLVFLDIAEDETGNILGRVIKEIAELKGLNSDGTYKLDYVYKYEQQEKR